MLRSVRTVSIIYMKYVKKRAGVAEVAQSSIRKLLRSLVLSKFKNKIYSSKNENVKLSRYYL